MNEIGTSYCPVCWAPTQGWLEIDESVYLGRRCNQHGVMRSMIFSSADYFDAAESLSNSQVLVSDRCLVVEVTERCDVGCATCSASSVDFGLDESPADMARGVKRAALSIGASTIALSGGEPLMRTDLWELADAIREFAGRVVLITSGRNIESDKTITAEMAARSSWLEVYLQFDSFDRNILRALRTPLITPELREARLKTCIDTGAATCAVCVVMPDTHAEEIEALVHYLKEEDAAGVTFQPLRRLGRYPVRPTRDERLSTVDGIQRVALGTLCSDELADPFPAQPFDISVAWVGGDDDANPRSFFKPARASTEFRIATSSYWDVTNYFRPHADRQYGYFSMRNAENGAVLLNRHYFDQAEEEGRAFFEKQQTRPFAGVAARR